MRPAWSQGPVTVAALITVVGALAALDAERAAPDSSISTYPEALWWAIVTITTVGYGDYSPVTVEGRLLALAMMIGGIGLIGFVTGSLASWIVERISADGTSDDEAGVTRSDIAGLREEIHRLRTELAALRAPNEISPQPPQRPHRGPGHRKIDNICLSQECAGAA